VITEPGEGQLQQSHLRSNYHLLRRHRPRFSLSPFWSELPARAVAGTLYRCREQQIVNNQFKRLNISWGDKADGPALFG